MKRKVLHYEYSPETCGILVTQSEESARIEARRLHQWHVDHEGFSKPMTDDEVLEEWMIVNWAWFDG